MMSWICPIKSGVICLLAALLLVARSASGVVEFVCAGTGDAPAHDGSAAKHLAAAASPQTLRALVIFAEFEQTGSRHGVPGFAVNLFDRERPGSLTHFYSTMSHGQFLVEGFVLPRRYESDSPASAYVAAADDQRGLYGQFVREILRKADGDFNFAEFDNDGPDGLANSGDDDGFVDYIFVNVESTPPRFFIGNATGIGGLGMDDPYVSEDLGVNGEPIQVPRYTSGGSVLREGNFEQTVGIMAHELGHHLGLPDLFDRSYPSPAEDSAGIGRWGLMAWGTGGWNGHDGPNPFSAWSLEQLGWIGVDNERLVEVSGEHKVAAFTPLGEGGHVYKLATRNPFEYFLVEHRRPVTNYYERNLPGDGLLVWHVRNLRRGNRLEREKRVDLVCADGLYEDGGFPNGSVAAPFSGGDNLDFWSHDPDYAGSHAGNLGDATDLFDGVHYKEFSPTSNPPTLPGIGVFNIRREDGLLAADLHRDTRHRSGTIETNEVWRDSIIVVGDVVVAAGARLTIKPGTVVVFDLEYNGGGLDAERSELVIDGKLIVGELGRRPVVFTSAAPLPRRGDWYGIVVHFQGEIDIRNALIEYAHEGISGGGWNRPHILQAVTVRQARLTGIHLVRMRQPLTLSELEVSESGAGVRIQGSGPVRVTDSRFADNATVGFVQIGGSLQLLNSEFVDNGIENADGANVVLERTVGRIADNQFSGGVGIRIIESRDLAVDGNTLNRHTVGLLSSNSQPRVEGNRMVANELAVRVEGPLVPVRVSLNTVEDTERLLDNQASRQVNAANNWWGGEDELSIGQRMDGAVEWRPFLNFDPSLPLDFALKQNYPNPFNSGTTIEYTVGTSILGTGSSTVLDIFTITGSLIRRLVDEPTLPGHHAVSWDGRDRRGHAVASAVYFYRLRIGEHTETRRLLLLK